MGQTPLHAEGAGDNNNNNNNNNKLYDLISFKTTSNGRIS